MDEKKEKSTFEKFWDQNKYTIVGIGVVILAYRLGRKHGYNSAISVIDHSFDKLGEVLVDASELVNI